MGEAKQPGSRGERREIPETLTLERAKGLLIQAFKFSQGSATALRVNLAWAHNNFSHYRISEELARQLFEESLPAINKLLIPPKGKPAGGHTVTHKEVRLGHPMEMPFTEQFVKGTLRLVIEKMQKIFNHQEEWTMQKLNDQKILEDPLRVGHPFLNNTLDQQVMTDMINLDHRYLVERSGRLPGANDPFFSFICHYALGGNHTGYLEYDKMSQMVGQQIRSQIEEKQLNSELMSKLRKLVEVYRGHHPDFKIELQL